MNRVCLEMVKKYNNIKETLRAEYKYYVLSGKGMSTPSIDIELKVPRYQVIM